MALVAKAEKEVGHFIFNQPKKKKTSQKDMGGMHETFHDTINTLKRKPRRLAGTPANSVSLWLSLGGASILTYAVFIYKNFDFVRESRQRWLLNMVPDTALEDQTRMMNDEFFRSALTNLKKRQLGEQDSNPPSTYHSATF